MKVCLYLELESFMGVSGIGSALVNQRKALELNGVEYTSDLKDDFDIFHVNVVGLKSLIEVRMMKNAGKKVILHAHVTADDFRDSYRFSNEIAPYLRRYLTFYYNQADLVLCPSEYTKNVLRGYGVTSNIAVISNGIDIDKFVYSRDKRAAFRKANSLEGAVSLNVGHLFIRKGLETFVNTARSIDQNRFVWVGKRYKNLEDPRVKKLIEEAPDNITFMVNRVDDIVAAYSGCDIFFFPSCCENQGIVLLEASACKRPMLVRDTATYEGWLVDGVNCLKASTDEEFRQKLKDLMEDESLCKELGGNAYKMSRNHSLEIIGGKLKTIYEGLLRN